MYNRRTPSPTNAIYGPEDSDEFENGSIRRRRREFIDSVVRTKAERVRIYEKGLLVIGITDSTVIDCETHLFKKDYFKKNKGERDRVLRFLDRDIRLVLPKVEIIDSTQCLNMSSKYKSRLPFGSMRHP